MRRPERSLACALALLLALPGTLHGQQETGPPQGTGSQEPPPPGEPEKKPPQGPPSPPPGKQRQVVSEGRGGKKLEIAAGPGSILGKDELILKEYVDIKFGDSRLQADFVRYIPSTKQAYAEGNVILDQTGSRITADKVEYSLETETGTFYHARGYAEPQLQFDAARVEKISKDEMVLYGATFTACTQPIPYWSFKFSRGLLRLNDYAYLHDLRFKVGRVPVFYTPYLIWPIKTDRASGLLFPEFGYSRRSGTILSEALYWAIRRNMDATFYLDYLSFAGIGTGLEYRFVPNGAGRSEFTGYFIRDQVAAEQQIPGVPTDRWVVSYNQRQDYPSEWHLVSSANFISDFDYYRDFERDIRLSTIPQAISRVFLSRDAGFYSFNLRTERREQLTNVIVQSIVAGTPTLTTEEKTVVNWIEPEVELRGRRQRIGSLPFFWTLESSAGVFRKDEIGADYQRFDLFPVLSSRLSTVPWLDVDASAGLRDTYYSRSQRTDLVNGVEETVVSDRSFNRDIYQAGMTIIGPKLSRVFDRPDSAFSTQYKNTIEPTLRYVYTSQVTDPSRIIPFDQIDSITGNSNILTYSVVTRLFGKRPASPLEDYSVLLAPVGGRFITEGGQGARTRPRDAGRAEGVVPAEGGGPGEAASGEGGETEESKKPQLSTVEIATLEISQDYSFLGPLSVSSALAKERQVGPINATLRFNPSIHTSLDVRSAYDILFRTIREASLSANLKSPRRGFLDVTWTLQRDLETRAQQQLLVASGGSADTFQPFDRSQIGLAGETNLLGRRLLLGMQANYEVGRVLPGEARLRDQRYRFGYNTQCCGFQVELLNRNFFGSSNREIRVLINLKGVGNVIDLQSGIGGGPLP